MLKSQDLAISRQTGEKLKSFFHNTRQVSPLSIYVPGTFTIVVTIAMVVSSSLARTGIVVIVAAVAVLAVVVKPF